MANGEVRAKSGGMRRETRLASYRPASGRAGQCADLRLAVVGDDAAHESALHNDVTPALAHDRKAEPFQGAYDLSA
jgi:hypothetical protein